MTAVYDIVLDDLEAEDLGNKIPLHWCLGRFCFVFIVDQATASCLLFGRPKLDMPKMH
jgi:hypothetical protein